MHYFIQKKKNLLCEQVSVQQLAEEYGTPLYVYSAKTIVEHYAKLMEAFRALKPLICYSVKANSNLSILRLLVDKGSGLDIVSGGELYRAQTVGCAGSRIVYASVGKTEQEIAAAITYGILMFNVESVPELARIDAVARAMGKVVNVALRLNPDVESNTHTYITTGKKETKFGMDSATLQQVFSEAQKYHHVVLRGIHVHIGSQITSAAPFVNALRKTAKCLTEIKKISKTVEYLNIGGGLGIVYANERPQTAAQFADKVVPLLQKTGLKIIVEPGRFIVGNAGILVTKVLYIKDTPHKRFYIVDGGMNDLLRPALYHAYHDIVPVQPRHQRGNNSVKADVVGPICESGDFLAQDRMVNGVQEGDYVAVMSAGAYGFSMSSNYNSRPRSAEILVQGRRVTVIRERETYRDIIRHEETREHMTKRGLR